jgi:hypothetical protein
VIHTMPFTEVTGRWRCDKHERGSISRCGAWDGRQRGMCIKWRAGMGHLAWLVSDYCSWCVCVCVCVLATLWAEARLAELW